MIRKYVDVQLFGSDRLPPRTRLVVSRSDVDWVSDTGMEMMTTGYHVSFNEMWYPGLYIGYYPGYRSVSGRACRWLVRFSLAIGKSWQYVSGRGIFREVD